MLPHTNSHGTEADKTRQRAEQAKSSVGPCLTWRKKIPPTTFLGQLRGPHGRHPNAMVLKQQEAVQAPRPRKMNGCPWVVLESLCKTAAIKDFLICFKSGILKGSRLLYPALPRCTGGAEWDSYCPPCPKPEQCEAFSPLLPLLQDFQEMKGSDHRKAYSRHPGEP